MNSVFKWRPSIGLVPVISFILLVLIILAVLAAVFVSKYAGHNKEYLLRAGEQRVLGHQIAAYTKEAAAGTEPAFARLLDARNRVSQLMDELKNGQPDGALPPSPDAIQPQLRVVENAWLELRAHADAILGSQEQILIIGDTIGVLEEIMPDLLDSSDQFAKLLLAGKTTPRQVYLTTRQLMLSQRINTSLKEMLSGGAGTAEAIDQLTTDVSDYSVVLNGLLKGDKKLRIDKITDPRAVKQLKLISRVLNDVNDNLLEILEIIPSVLPALEVLADASSSELAAKALLAGEVMPDMDMTTELTSSSDRLSDQIGLLIGEYQASPGGANIGPVPIGPALVTVLGVLATLVLITLGVVMIRQSRERERRTEEQYQRNQDAIRRLLDEMGDLADGDLTVEATVTEDITGTIADSVNFAIESMRDLVESINDTSAKVSASAQENRATAIHLADASLHQREQIENTSSRIKIMSKAMTSMASDANESVKVAEHSLDIAAKGGHNVRSTIAGMDNIREQIQETSKRIKRLGESSQEIGNIIELIDDISDQTNILALNAAMQAAMAGEAGRGFAVVADEVQRLAERTSNATKQIEALVKTIQADTNAAVASMETSTSEVVDGAQLAEQAGESLHEIEEVSERIAGIIKRISGSAQDQSKEANNLEDTMNVIQEITNQTTEGTNSTAASIGVLSDQINELRGSVAGFRLPEA